MESYTPINYDTILSSLPPPPSPTNLSSEITQRQKSGTLPILVVLDDDPTGTQTCHGINVLTVWDHDTLIEEFKSTNSGFFILTNSRALHTPEARSLIKEICEAVLKAAKATGKDFEVVLSEVILLCADISQTSLKLQSRWSGVWTDGFSRPSSDRVGD